MNEPLSAPHGAPSSRAQQAIALQATIGNQHVQRLLEAAKPIARAEGDAETSPEGEEMDLPTAIGYVGMNPKAWKEAQGLEKQARDIVIVSLDDPALAQDLSSPEGRVSYLMTQLELHPLFDFPAFIQAWEMFEQVDSDARDQVAMLMKMFRGAEQGKYVLERLVMSGHSNGVSMWGEAEAEGESAPGQLLLERDLELLTQTFPGAAAQVQDVMFSACFSANAIELVARVFPNLQTAWGYEYFSPAAGKGSTGHIRAWERSTRGEDEPDEDDARGSAAIWTRQDGYVVGDPTGGYEIEVLVEALFGTDENRGGIDFARDMLEGEEPIDEDWLRAVYSDVQILIRHPDASAENVAAAEETREWMLRLRYWDNVTRGFNGEYSLEIMKAYHELGIERPQFDGMSRAALKSHIEEYDAALAEKGAPPNAVSFRAQQLQGLWTLDPAYIPIGWI